MTNTVELTLIDIDGFGRAVFKDENGKLYKSVALVPDGDPCHWTDDEVLDLIATLHTTDSIDGEPGFPVPGSTVYTITNL